MRAHASCRTVLEKKRICNEQMAKFVGEKTRRSVLDSEGFEIGYCIGEVVEWKSAEKSEVLSGAGEPVELWRVKPCVYCVYEKSAGKEFAVR